MARTTDLRHCEAGTVECDKDMVAIVQGDFCVGSFVVTKRQQCTGRHDSN